MSLFRKLITRLDSPSTKAPPNTVDADEGRGPRKVRADLAVTSLDAAGVLEEAHTLIAAARYADALLMVEERLQDESANNALLYMRAHVLLAWGRIREARDGVARANPSELPNAGQCVLLGRIAFHSGIFPIAEDWARKAIAQGHAGTHALLNLAASLHAQDRLDEAIVAYEEALQLDAGLVDALLGLGNCNLDQGNRSAAEGFFRRAIAIDAQNVMAWQFLAFTLDGIDEREAEAHDAHATAIATEDRTGRHSEARYLLAGSLAYAGKVHEALQHFEKYLPRRPVAKAFLLYAHTLLTAGFLREGLHFNEFRWLTPYFLERRLRVSQPQWSGQDLQGKRILLHVEQGLGDTIQFVRFAPLVKQLGATVYLAVRPEFQNLGRDIAGVDQVLVMGNDRIPEMEFYIHLMSLPAVLVTLGIHLAATIPYLRTTPQHARKWSSLLGPEKLLNVGLVWAGNPQHPGDAARSIALPALSSLASVTGVRFFSLQKGVREGDLHLSSNRIACEELGSRLEDLRDTAAVIAQLDLVITVDTAVGHLAGAMGKRVWMLIGQPPDWRWLEKRSDTPWYPTMRLFRQKRRGDWTGAIEDVRSALVMAVADCENSHAGAQNVDDTTVANVDIAVAVREGPGAALSSHWQLVQSKYGPLICLPNGRGSGRSLSHYGEWLQPQVDMLQQLVRAGAVVIEAGSGEGSHALTLASLATESGHLMLYEPDPAMRIVLEQNISGNSAKGVTIMRRPLGQRGSDVGATTALHPADCDTIDGLRLERLDLLKVNDPAATAAVLDGAADALWRLRPVLFLAVRDEVDLLAKGAFVRTYGYRSWAINTPLFNPGNFFHREDDVFHGERKCVLMATPEEMEPPALAQSLAELK
jgi:tetratricopeptide (TPR) repeat protein